MAPCVFVLALAAVAVGPTGHAAAAAPGAVADVTWWGQTRENIDRELALLDAAGVEWIRANANWNELENAGKGEIDESTLEQYDYAVDRARAYGIEVLMSISDGVPYWASSDPNKRIVDGWRQYDPMYPPRLMSDYGDIVRFVVDHFSARGVRNYEIWNEPNHPRFWRPAPKARQYVKMLRAGYRGAKSANRHARVILGGLSLNDHTYLRQVYKSGGRRFFDAVAVHPYTATDPTVKWDGRQDGAKGSRKRLSWKCFPALKEIRRTMKRRGDRRKKVWITEFGYSTAGEWGVSEATQAAYLSKAFRYVDRFPWVKAMFWYHARDLPFGDDLEAHEANFGLLSNDFEPKPSYYALRAYAN